MFENAQDIEIAALLALILIFEIWERRRPARKIDRLAGLRIDLLSFGFALLVNRLSTHAVLRGIDAVGPSFVSDGLHSLRALPAVARIALSLVVVDFLLYWFHRAQHASPLLWHTHAWHHSIEQLYWFSGFRTSFLHSLFYNIPQTVVPLFVFGLSPLEAGAAYSVGVLVQFLEHTNLRLAVGPLRFAFITPQYHRIHHAASEFRGRNFAFVFPIWDALFGTQVDPERVDETFPLGLGETVERAQMPRMMVGV